MSIDALLEAYERSLMAVVDYGDTDLETRQLGQYAFYGLKDLTKSVLKDMEELADIMDSYNVLKTAVHIRKRGVQNG